mgnify:FL=1
MSYQTVRITRGRGGWGDGLTLTPTADKDVVLSVTNGGIHPVAARIAELSGSTAVDGFVNHVDDDRVLCAVINCGGTARIGVYPRKRIPTVDIYPGSPSGPLAQFITEDIFVSAVGVDQVAVVAERELAYAGEREGGHVADGGSSTGRPSTGGGSRSGSLLGGGSSAPPAFKPVAAGGGFTGVVVKFGGGIGYVINSLLAAGRQALQLTLQTIIPFMAYVSLLIGIVTYTGVSNWIAKVVSPMVGNPIGLVLLGIITAIPVLSPILGPGAAIAQVIGVLMGTQIATGALAVQYALPTLFAIDGQVGCDFVPVGVSLGEAKPETVAVGVPAVLFSRLITSPIAVIIAYLAGFLVA